MRRTVLSLGGSLYAWSRLEFLRRPRQGAQLHEGGAFEPQTFPATFGEAREADIRFVSAFLRSQIRNELIGDSSRVSTDFGSRLSVPIIIMWPRPYQLSISRPSSSKNSMPISGMSGRPRGTKVSCTRMVPSGKIRYQGQSGYRSRLDLVVTGDHDGRTFRMPAQGQQFPPVVGRSPHAARSGSRLPRSLSVTARQKFGLAGASRYSLPDRA